MFTQLLAPDTFEFFARYLLAGYVVIIVRARWVAGLRPKTAEQIVEAVLFSLIVQAVAGACGRSTTWPPTAGLSGRSCWCWMCWCFRRCWAGCWASTCPRDGTVQF